MSKSEAKRIAVMKGKALDAFLTTFAKGRPTPRTDALVRELQRIKAGDWTIDLLSHAQELERELIVAAAPACHFNEGKCYRAILCVGRCVDEVT